MYRTKGILWLASRPTDVLLWQQAGSQIAFELTSFWAAATLNDDMLLPVEVAMIQKRVDAIHPIFGDRRTALTLIGLPEACRAFAADLQGAFCTEEEILAWQRGAVFSDPWPKSVRKIT
jgi:G3E family GTPase